MFFVEGLASVTFSYHFRSLTQLIKVEDLLCFGQFVGIDSVFQLWAVAMWSLEDLADDSLFHLDGKDKSWPIAKGATFKQPANKYKSNLYTVGLMCSSKCECVCVWLCLCLCVFVCVFEQQNVPKPLSHVEVVPSECSYLDKVFMTE